MSPENKADQYDHDVICRARSGALVWLAERDEGFPRSWEQEAKDTARRGYELYDEIEAPPIAGYEALENEGLAERHETRTIRGEERIRFTITDAGHAAYIADNQGEA